ncbi:Uncharacterized protein involved in exopolysaccharide biosynthesis [Cyclonatronum proteinivorum]|uniref:Uncharacterized protein involved in exopolysaccharide biosynthesis n=1 Tax=Cyclonatronum proteinivorum TaxID=1457365 RepID=A0A345UGY2_9BACT|nr:GNVR domain-containing protein [Cyclonatronum proteinivorum]AXI99733.1 Uncharacterized protein involved in exopolysaccharide biosynthesis [Cyclonatronum proteinivorum]
MNQPEEPKSINLLDLLLSLVQEKWFIIKTVFAVTFLSLVISLVWPETFKSESTILPVSQSGGPSLGGLAGLAGNLLPLSFSGESINTEALGIILNSRTLRKRVIEEFDLMEVYGHKVIEQTLRTLDNNTRINYVREGGFGFNPITAIELSVTDREPERAQAMTAFYVSFLDSVATRLNEANNIDRFRVIEKRYLQNLAELEEAELRFKAFQEEHGLIDIEQQSAVLVQSMASVASQIMELDIEINLLRTRVEPGNPELNSLIRTRTELQRALNDLNLQGDRQFGDQARFLPGFSEIPDLGLQYMRLYRDMIIQGKIYETIFPQYVQQQMLVESPRRNIQVIDVAHLPTYKDGPKRAFIVIGGFFFSLFISLFIVLFRGYSKGLEKYNKEDYERLNQIKAELFRFRK